MLTRVYTPEEEKERAMKALKLNGFESLGYDYDPRYDPKLLAASSKPIVRIKRLGFSGHSPNNIKLKGASSVRKYLNEEKEKAEKAFGLNWGF
jgi:hypothetical protein